MHRYRTAVIGLGPRGMIHLHGLAGNADSFQIVGICDRHKEKLEQASHRYQIPEECLYTDAEQMMNVVRPEVLVFVTMPADRLPLVLMAVRYRVKGLMFEKPMAESLQEAYQIKELCETNGIKAVVCHQHKYLPSFQALKEKLNSGELGEIYEIQAECQPHASQLGTHYIDYMLWANGEIPVESVVGHVHGSDYLQDSHPSPDYVMGRMIFGNGVRGLLECGYLARPHREQEGSVDSPVRPLSFWTDDRLTVYGTRGYAWAECSGYYGWVTSQGLLEEPQGFAGSFEEMQYEAQICYTKAFARWMRNDQDVHPCRVSLACHGYEILEAMYLSAIGHTRVDLPIDPPYNTSIHSVLESILTPISNKNI